MYMYRKEVLAGKLFGNRRGQDGKQTLTAGQTLTADELNDKERFVLTHGAKATRTQDKARHARWCAELEELKKQQAALSTRTDLIAAQQHADSRRTDLIVAQQEADFASSSSRHDKSEAVQTTQSADIHTFHSWSKEMVTAHNALEQSSSSRHDKSEDRLTALEAKRVRTPTAEAKAKAAAKEAETKRAAKVRADAKVQSLLTKLALAQAAAQAL